MFPGPSLSSFSPGSVTGRRDNLEVICGSPANQPRQHHLTIPNHDSLRIGTLAAILADVATHHGLSRDELIARLFGR